jgi:hypothetical protein
MKTKHTKAPWLTENNFVYALNNNNENIFYLSVQAGWGDRTKKVALRTSPEELEANARLIAAAPDLLEALKLAKAWMSSAGVDSADLEGYRINKQFIVDTIAKAEGDTK